MRDDNAFFVASSEERTKGQGEIAGDYVGTLRGFVGQHEYDCCGYDYDDDIAVKKSIYKEYKRRLS